MRVRAILLTSTLCLLAAGPVPAAAQSSGKASQDAPAPIQQDAETAATGGAEYGTVDPDAFPTVPGRLARIGRDGIASAPEDAPEAVKRIIWAGNEIVGMPYRLGGGHVEGFEDDAYDCSGTISYALAGADLLRSPLDSRRFASWGRAGRGNWVTVHTNPSHAYLVVAGIRLDTSAADHRGGGKGPRWRPLRKSNRGYAARRPARL